MRRKQVRTDSCEEKISDVRPNGGLVPNNEAIQNWRFGQQIQPNEVVEF